MNIFYWLLGYETQPVLPQVENPEEIEENFVFVETKESRRREILQLRDKLPQFPVHQLDLSASVCCASDAAQQIQKLAVKVPKPVTMPVEFLEEGPYALAFWSQVVKSKSQFSKSLYFIDSSILAARGSMSTMEKVHLLSGEPLSCNAQVFTDLHRWGENAFFVLDGETHSLADLRSSPFSIGVSESREVPYRMVTLLDTIHLQLKSNSVFSLFTRYFHQGPFNDMVYSMMADCSKRWDVSLVPDQKGMSRTFNLTFDRDNKVHKLIISVKGYFNSGYIPGVGTMEPQEERKLGSFYGVTIVNLRTGAAFIRTFVDMYRDQWVAS